MSQTIEQAEKAFVNWLKQLPAKNIVIVDSQENLNVLVAFIRNKCGGVFTSDNLDKALSACWNVLAFEDGKSPADPNDKLQKKIQSMKKQEAGILPRNVKTEFDKVETQQTSVYTEAKQKAQDAKNRQTQAAVDTIIETYSVNSAVGRINHSRTQERKDQLRKICVKRSSGEIDWNATKDAVESQIRQWTFGA